MHLDVCLELKRKNFRLRPSPGMSRIPCQCLVKMRQLLHEVAYVCVLARCDMRRTRKIEDIYPGAMKRSSSNRIIASCKVSLRESMQTPSDFLIRRIMPQKRVFQVSCFLLLSYLMRRFYTMLHSYAVIAKVKNGSMKISKIMLKISADTMPDWRQTGKMF